MSSPHATRAALNRYLAATPAYFATPSSYLAARPLVLYLGAKALGLGLAWVVLRVAGKSRSHARLLCHFLLLPCGSSPRALLRGQGFGTGTGMGCVACCG